ncbi:MAG: N-acetylmuramoyl-L-alanine amidase [Nocardioidaceae bacterium]|nr:N-acetylmuramoyl-L-alanine amidase [Nocardioidaceae bacterium]
MTQTAVDTVSATKRSAGLLSAVPAQRGRELVAHVTQSVQDQPLVGVTWLHGSAPDGLDVQVRALRASTWSAWTDVHVNADTGLVSDEQASVRDGTEPLWVGSADRVEVAAYSTDGSVPQQMRLQTIDPGTSSYDTVALGQSKTAAATTSLAGTFPGIPDIVTRRQWGADESMGDQCWAPRLGTAFKMVFVHHTVGSNSYSRSESAAVVRGIYAYHTQSQRWCDIGYNFLVDRYGTVFEGRDGGIRQPVRGSHAGDYNTDTTGISLMGNFETGYPTNAMKTALVRLIAWRMGTAYRDAYGGAVVEGSWFRRIAGHRDAMSTACPGAHVYSWLPRLRERVAERLGSFESRIERAWLYRGGPKSEWGPVRVGEQHDHRGAHTRFEGGRMYRFDDAVRAWKRGPILRRYVNSGETDGELGYPVSVMRSPRHGRAADFEHGSIFWSRSAGTHILRPSSILKRYRALGGAESDLAFPTSHVLTTKSGARTNFQRGAITFDKTTQRLTVTYE